VIRFVIVSFIFGTEICIITGVYSLTLCVCRVYLIYKSVRRHTRLTNVTYFIGLELPLLTRICLYADEAFRNLLSNGSLIGITCKQPTAWCRGRLMKLLVAQLVSVFPTFYRTWTLITVFENPGTLPCPGLIESTLWNPISSWFTSILSSHQRLLSSKLYLKAWLLGLWFATSQAPSTLRGVA
jgi:hypothetical protein